MAALTLQQASVTGTAITFTAASGGGDTVDINGTVYLLVKNGSGGSITVTIVRPGSEYGVAIPDIPVAVAAAAETIIGPIPQSFEDTTTFVVNVTYSGVTSLTVAAIRGA